MADNLYRLLFDLRLVVGYLGEKDQSRWWESSFLSPSSKSFLVPVFAKTTLLAQYHGVCKAAALVHDEHIGLGLHYHLYRLPNSVERLTARSIENDDHQDRASAPFTDSGLALSYLEQFCASPVVKSEGPLIVGDYSDTDLESLLRKSASYYFDAFSHGYKTFPYLRQS
jgi:hypothetical protein